MSGNLSVVRKKSWNVPVARIAVVCSVLAFIQMADAAIALVSPKDGETVSQLWPIVKNFLDLPRDARKENAFRISAEEKDTFKNSRGAKPVEFAWKGDTNGIYTLTVKRLPDGKVFHSAVVTGCTAAVTGRLEIAREWVWTVAGGGEVATGRFATEDRAPRIIALDGVINARDIGGRIGLGGRRIRQGLVFRTGGLNHDADAAFYTYDEIIALYKEGKLAQAGVGRSRGLGAKYEETLKSGKDLDRNFLRLFKHGPTKPGAVRLSEADKAYILGFLGVKTDIDLRNDWESFGMTGSPLGDSVTWSHCSYSHGYRGFVMPVGRASVANVFAVFTDRGNYPIIFHCMGGMDRTGTFAYLLEGLLGVEEEELIRDYEMSFIASGGVDKRHYGWLTGLVEAVRELPGRTLADKMNRYFLTLGFTQDEIDGVRDFLLEPADETRPAAIPMPERGLCAHQGDMQHFPGNSVESLVSAVKNGASMVEFDVQRCKSGEFVLYHDPTLTNPNWVVTVDGTPGTGRIDDYTLAELKSKFVLKSVQKSANGATARFATLDEALAVLPRSNLWINVHCYVRTRFVQDVARKIAADGRLHQAFLSTSIDHIKEARKAVPGIMGCNMSRPGPRRRDWTEAENMAYALDTVTNGCQFLQLCRRWPPKFSKIVHDAGGKVNFYRSNTPAELEGLLDDGVDFILTDRLGEMLPRFRELAADSGSTPATHGRVFQSPAGKSHPSIGKDNKQ